jgi:hypothetical protein
MGAEGFNGRVRNGIGFVPLARATRPAKHRHGRQARAEDRGRTTEDRGYLPFCASSDTLVFLTEDEERRSTDGSVCPLSSVLCRLQGSSSRTSID